VNVGKLRMTELAMGTFGTNPIQGTPTNPRAPDRIPGGSSSGSAAAVAAGLVPIAIGTDTGGSIRIPAACCGVVGLKPTYGLIGTAGIMPLAPTLDHVGVIAGSVRDAALALLGVADLAPADRLRGALERLVAAPGPRVFVVGVPEGDDFDDVHPDVAAALATSASRLEHAGATISRIRLPHVTTLIDATAVIVRVEASAAHAYRIDRGDTMAPFVRARLSAGLDVRAVDYLSARRELDAARTAFVREVFGIVDALLLPMTPEPALRLGETEGDPDTVGRRMARFARFARFFNGLGIPAISVPAGASREGVPLAVQVAAAPFQDDTVLAAAAALTRERECT
jgi:aspartyl-tRNA(Asn)/glutamyl-tRNA(Gln) amidotransferase subunit A